MMTAETLAVPTVHLNGTSKESLLSDLCEAINAIHDAGRKLAAACPNGRDYYVQPDGAFRAAQRQHESRMQRLKSVATELETIAEKVCDQ